MTTRKPATASKTEAFNDTPFSFSTDGKTFVADGDDFTIASFGSFSAGDIRKVRHLDDVSQMFTLVEKVADDETLAAIDELSISEVAQFFGEWQRAAGVDLPS